MAELHSTAIVRGDVTLADDVTVGPSCVLDGSLGPVTIGAGTTLIGNVYLQGPITIGIGNTFYPFTCMGFAPQDFGFDPARAGCGTTVGDHNVFRESCVIHRATTDEGPTTIGNHVYLMNHTHAGHDCRIGDYVTMAGNAMLGGHVTVGERVTIGGNTAIHQFCRLGRGSMLSGGVSTTGDVPPFFLVSGFNFVGGPNLVGMRRQKFPSDSIEDVRWAYKVIYRRRLPPFAAVEVLRERADRPIVAEYIEFIEASKRGLCLGHGLEKRPQVHADPHAAAVEAR